MSDEADAGGAGVGDHDAVGDAEARSHTVSRRRFLGGLGAVGAGAVAVGFGGGFVAKAATSSHRPLDGALLR